jgi:hypothetical protein
MAGSYRAQTGHLTRTIKTASALVKEAALDQLWISSRGHLPGFVIRRQNVQQFARTSGMLRSGQRPTRTTSRGA